jgi:hypothetical protein
MSKVQQQINFGKSVDRYNEMLKKGINNLEKEGYTVDRLELIISNEMEYQSRLKKYIPMCGSFAASNAMIEACKFLLNNLITKKARG